MQEKNVDDVKLPNYEVIGHGNMKILILGGSTTSSHTAVHLDPNIHSIDESYSWPRELVQHHWC